MGGSFQSLNLITENLVKDHHVSILYSHYKSHEYIKTEGINYLHANDGRGLLNFCSRVMYKLNKHVESRHLEKAGGFFESLPVRQHNHMIKELRPDLIVFNNTPYIDHQFIKAASGYKCKKICHLRLNNKESIFNQKGFRHVISRDIDRFVANSHAVKESWAGNWGIEANKIHVLHNAVHSFDDTLSPEIVDKIRQRTNTLKVVCIGRINDEKGQEFLLDTLLSNKSILGAATFFFIGDGPITGRLKSLTESHGVNDEIIFLDYVPNARNYLPMFDMAIVPSRCEPFGNVILESMQAGVPVISTDQGGPAEIITDGHDGLLVPYGDQARLLEAIHLLKNDSERNESIRNNALNTFMTRFSKEEFLRNLFRIYFD